VVNFAFAWNYVVGESHLLQFAVAIRQWSSYGCACVVGLALDAERRRMHCAADRKEAQMSSVSRDPGGLSTARSGILLRLLMAIAAIGTMTGVAVVGFVATAGPAAAVGCSGDTWTNTSGGSWDTNGNWSNDAPPSGSTAACITAPGSYTVTIGNETISAGAVTLGASGSTPTLAIGNNLSSEPAVTFANVTNTAGSSLTFNWGGTLTVTGAFTNAGTVDESLNEPSAFTIASFDNQGTFQTGAGSTYALPSSSATFLNDTTGTLSVPSADSLTFSSPGGDTGTVTQDGTVDNSGTLTVQDELSVEGGSICGTAPQVGVDGGSIGTLNFAATVSTGSPCGTGIETDNIDIANVSSNGTLSGNIPSAYTVVIGNGGSSCPSISIAGALTNSGTLEPSDCTTLTDTSSLTNSGTIEVPNTGFSGATFDLSSFTNNGSFDVDTTSTYTMPTSASTFTNGSAGTVDVLTGTTLTLSSPSANVGTFTQDGTIDLAAANAFTVEDAVAIDGGSICGAPLEIGTNGGSVGSLTFESSVGSGSCNSGSLKDNIDFANIPTNGTLSGNIPAAYTVEMGNGGSSYPNITLSGAITNSGTLSMGWEGTFTDTSTLTNKGTLEVPASTFSSVFDLTNLVNKGTFAVDAPVTWSLPTSGSIDNSSTGTISVATGQTLAVSSTASPQGSVTQAGIIDNHGTLNVEAPVSISGGSICGNRLNVGLDGGVSQTLTFVGAVAAGPACGTGLASDQVFMANITGTLAGSVPRGYTVVIGDGGSSYAHITSTATSNAGVIEPEDGGTMTFTGSSFTNTGTLEFPTNTYTSTEFVFNSNVTSSGKITANAGGTFVLPSGDTLTTTKKIKIAGTGTVLNITGSLANTKTLQIAAGDALDVTGTYSQSSLGTFKPGLASATSIGVLNVTGTASIAGTVTAKLSSGYHPSNGTTWVVLKSAWLGSTTFTTVSGTYSAQYVSSDSNVQLTFT